MVDALDFGQETAYTSVTQLVDAGVVKVTHDEQPRTYTAREIDLTITAATGDREYTVMPALINAVGRRETDDDIDTYIDRHGIAGRATAFTYAVDRERGQTTHRRMAQTLDLAPLEADTLLQALRHVDVEVSRASVVDIDNVDPEIASAPETEFQKSARSANECFGEEDPDEWAPHAVEEDEHD